LAQDAGREALEAMDDLGNAACRVGFDEPVNAVGPHFQGVNRDTEFSGFFV
jgi:hypothetical protein